MPEQLPRIGGTSYNVVRYGALAVYNADYMVDGTRYEHFDKPWTVIGAGLGAVYARFATHAEALQWALQEARK